MKFFYLHGIMPSISKAIDPDEVIMVSEDTTQNETLYGTIFFFKYPRLSPFFSVKQFPGVTEFSSC